MHALIGYFNYFSPPFTAFINALALSEAGGGRTGAQYVVPSPPKSPRAKHPKNVDTTGDGDDVDDTARQRLCTPRADAILVTRHTPYAIANLRALFLSSLCLFSSNLPSITIAARLKASYATFCHARLRRFTLSPCSGPSPTYTFYTFNTRLCDSSVTDTDAPLHRTTARLSRASKGSLLTQIDDIRTNDEPRELGAGLG
ncbi:uncharacterized protein SPSK_02772 [Sporothrix schenckii 1099-18]|uniref:Uncharacterized protein n=1 Tax=Sporothrix schenckii 1099-18 TaxID=1397361 RepID=A0A0F2MB82_SPOSC|nr:uncharacterized protein SPSK_02772 [Sporothrix schenckii 1099-18]KJR86349.1 hypothetical protein SPSK_02772 [Sporothrix schenckii 1099-18]